MGAVAGGIAGAAVFGGMTELGVLLSSRLGVPALIPILVMAVAGAYAGWLLGVIVFSAVRGPVATDERS